MACYGVADSQIPSRTMSLMGTRIAGKKGKVDIESDSIADDVVDGDPTLQFVLGTRADAPRCGGDGFG